MELRFKVDDTFMQELSAQLKAKQFGEVSGTRITQDALALFKWAVEETSKGRVIVSANPDISEPQRVVMPSLSGVANPTSKS